MSRPQQREAIAAIEAGSAYSETGKVAIVSRKLEVPSHPFAQDLLAFWQGHRSGGKILHKRMLPARELSKLMPFLMLLEPDDPHGYDWRFRLVGSAIVERMGNKDTKGKLLSEGIAADIAEERARIYRHVIETLTPNIARGRITGTGREFQEIEVVHVPVEADDGALWIFGGVFFFG